MDSSYSLYIFDKERLFNFKGVQVRSPCVLMFGELNELYTFIVSNMISNYAVTDGQINIGDEMLKFLNINENYRTDFSKFVAEFLQLRNEIKNLTNKLECRTIVNEGSTEHFIPSDLEISTYIPDVDISGFTTNIKK